MALPKKWKLSAVNRESQKEHSRPGTSKDTSVSKMSEDYITQVSKEVEVDFL